MRPFNKPRNYTHLEIMGLSLQFDLVYRGKFVLSFATLVITHPDVGL